MRNYYLLNNGRLLRKDNTLYVENAAGEKKPIPIEDVDGLYVYGEVDLNTKLLNFLAQKRVVLHVFNYYGFYSGSYYPREYLHSGHLLVHQVRHYTDSARRLLLSRELVRASAHSMLRNVSYYANRAARSRTDPGTEPEPIGEVGTESADVESPSLESLEGAVDSSLTTGIPPLDLTLPEEEPDPLLASVNFDLLESAVEPLAALRQTIASLAELIDAQEVVNAVRGIEGKMRERYYQCWRHILTGDWSFHQRVRRPPDNEVNALISFGNSVLYTACLSEIYRTQLTPTISYLHEPGARRFSLALDLSEIFKPLLVDRAIFRLLNTNQLKEEHFDRSLGSCYLTDLGKKLFLASLEERLASTIHHRRLGRHVSYRHLIRLECYKLIRHLTDVEPFRAFRAWW
jgi:CRISPR-associated protein Cas1